MEGILAQSTLPCSSSLSLRGGGGPGGGAGGFRLRPTPTGTTVVPGKPGLRKKRETNISYWESMRFSIISVSVSVKQAVTVYNLARHFFFSVIIFPDFLVNYWNSPT